MRVLAVITACWLLLCAGSAYGDGIGTSVVQLGGSSSERVRLAAALTLSKEHDPRAVIALAGALHNDADIGIRRVAALALAKLIDAHTAPDAVELAFTALDGAKESDPSADVSAAAANTLRTIAKYRPTKTRPRIKGKGPAVFVNIDPTVDQSKQLPAGGSARVEKVVKDNVQRTGYATTWPAGGLPTSTELVSAGSRGFIVASTVKTIVITQMGTQTQIACKVEVRVAPWTGRDGGERWEANRAASASGSAKVTTGNRPRMINNGVADCLEAVAEDVTSRQVVPFLKRIATSN